MNGHDYVAKASIYTRMTQKQKSKTFKCGAAGFLWHRKMDGVAEIAGVDIAGVDKKEHVAGVDNEEG